MVVAVISIVWDAADESRVAAVVSLAERATVFLDALSVTEHEPVMDRVVAKVTVVLPKGCGDVVIGREADVDSALTITVRLSDPSTLHDAVTVREKYDVNFVTLTVAEGVSVNNSNGVPVAVVLTLKVIEKLTDPDVVALDVFVEDNKVTLELGGSVEVASNELVTVRVSLTASVRRDTVSVLEAQPLRLLLRPATDDELD